MGLKLNTASSGSVTLEPANTASNYTLTVPAQTGTVVALPTWTITESAGVLYFAVSGVNKAKLDASGNLTVVGNITAYGTV